MEPDLLGAVEREEVLVEGEGVVVGWGEHALGLDLAGVASVPTVGLSFPIK
ncbi:unnamed protein product [marine sediment metagenome]|uniref:Uncharacterized protein n=1 Tax=marine sediment metagenome TaxID=412755 RepID=X1PMF6_9ZZZZ